MRCHNLTVLAILALGAACSKEHARAEEAEVAADGGFSPLPEPADLDLTAFCAQDPLDAFELIANVHVWLLDADMLGKRTDVGSRAWDRTYEGEIGQLEKDVPTDVVRRLYIEGTAGAYRSALLNVEGGTMRLVGNTRSLGLREGASFEAFESYRPNVFVSSDYRLTVQSEGQTVFHAEYAAFTEDLKLPDDLLVERAERLCAWEDVLGGDLYALRISNSEGERIVLQPGQARSLGDYDIYLWMALYPAQGQAALRGIDNRTATTEIAVVRRVFHERSL